MVSPEIAQEVGMLFEDQDGDHAGRTPAGDAATDRNLAGRHGVVLPARFSSAAKGYIMLERVY